MQTVSLANNKDKVLILTWLNNKLPVALANPRKFKLPSDLSTIIINIVHCIPNIIN